MCPEVIGEISETIKKPSPAVTGSGLVVLSPDVTIIPWSAILLRSCAQEDGLGEA